MRILLAVDGSVCSDRATELVSSFAFPPDSVVRVIGGPPPYTDAPGALVGGDGRRRRQPRDRGRGRPTGTCARPSRAPRPSSSAPGLKVEGFLLHGRPGSAIVDEAGAMAADIVVVGSRGHGTIATMLLGSTASEIVDHAPCPVLVARHRHLGPLAFADDGSRSARNAEQVFTSLADLRRHARQRR